MVKPQQRADSIVLRDTMLDWLMHPNKLVPAGPHNPPSRWPTFRPACGSTQPANSLANLPACLRVHTTRQLAGPPSGLPVAQRRRLRSAHLPTRPWLASAYRPPLPTCSPRPPFALSFAHPLVRPGACSSAARFELSRRSIIGYGSTLTGDEVEPKTERTSIESRMCTLIVPSPSARPPPFSSPAGPYSSRPPDGSPAGTHNSRPPDGSPAGPHNRRPHCRRSHSFRPPDGSPAGLHSRRPHSERPHSRRPHSIRPQ